MLQIDVKAAFLNDELSDELFMEQPEGCRLRDKADHASRLHKAIYGLRQASRAWRRYLNNLLQSLVCTLSLSDPGLYLKTKDGRLQILFIVFVDDILMAGCNMYDMRNLARQLGLKVGVRIEEKVKKF